MVSEIKTVVLCMAFLGLLVCASIGVFKFGFAEGRLVEKVELEHYLKAQLITPQTNAYPPLDTADNSEEF